MLDNQFNTARGMENVYKTSKFQKLRQDKFRDIYTCKPIIAKNCRMMLKKILYSNFL